MTIQRFVTQYNIENILEKLAPAHRKALEDFNWEKKVVEIGDKGGFIIEEVDGLMQEVGLVLLGVEPAEGLRYRLKDRVHISDHEMDDLMHKLNSLIFIPIRDQMKKNDGSTEKTDEGDELTHEQVLSEIEEHAAPKKSDDDTSLVKDKLQKLFHVKSEKTDHAVTKPNKDEKPVAPKSYGEKDPYHEPID